jgi:hypothetical protein
MSRLTIYKASGSLFPWQLQAAIGLSGIYIQILTKKSPCDG